MYHHIRAVAVCISILVISAIVSSIPISNLQVIDTIESYAEKALELQSSYADTDNLDTVLDTKKTSCMYYVTERRKWTNLFGDDENGKKRKFAIAGMQSARGELMGGAANSPIVFFDACVIPKELLSSYGVDDTCMLKTVDANVQLQKSSALMTPEGCMVDFSGQLSQISGNDSGKGQQFTQATFGDLLLKAYSGMNYNNEMMLKKLNETIDQKNKDISERDNTIVNKDTIITSKTKEVSEVNRKLGIAEGEEPSWVFDRSLASWVTPANDEYIATARDLGITSHTNMSVTFWIKITNLSGNWRNIFQMTRKSQFGPYQLKYDADEDLYRRPAVYIMPNRKTLHIAHDTKDAPNVTCDVDGILDLSMVALVWNGRALNAYINGIPAMTFSYKSDLLDADKTAQLFFASRFFYGDGFTIRHLKWYNTSLSKERVNKKYNIEQTMV